MSRYGFGATIERDEATGDASGARFRVWAPSAGRVDLALDDGGERPLARQDQGIFTGFVAQMPAGTRYRYRLDGERLFPDPASRFQPDGPHGPSEVVDPAGYAWRDDQWQGIPRADLVFYELHVGTFSLDGDFAGVRNKLAYLRDLGVTAVELMPVHDFPGRWNWGYDPAAHWAPAHPYGSPDDMRALVDEAHQLGLAVFLDVVYNHFGPDGAYTVAYGPFLTDRHRTSWGQAVNLRPQDAAPVRAYMIENALHWLEEYHIDGLRLDATYALIDDSPKHLLAELSEAVAQLDGPPRHLVAEDDRNLARILHPLAQKGYGMHAVWADDFHHLVRRLAAGDCHGYFQDYPASTTAIAQTIENGWFFTGQPSRYWGRPRGSDPSGLSADQFVFCTQNHDQIGNRPCGDRLNHAIDPGLYRAVSALLLFVPELPLLFMGQEWGATTPFCYFTDHNEELGRAVSEGRRREFAGFPGFSADLPDPQDPATFAMSKLDWAEMQQMPHAGLVRLYRDLLRWRRRLRGVARAIGDNAALRVERNKHCLIVAFAATTAPLPRGAAVVWHTEQQAYAEVGQAPQLEDGAAHFAAPAALIAEVG